MIGKVLAFFAMFAVFLFIYTGGFSPTNEAEQAEASARIAQKIRDSRTPGEVETGISRSRSQGGDGWGTGKWDRDGGEDRSNDPDWGAGYQ